MGVEFLSGMIKCSEINDDGCATLGTLKTSGLTLKG